MVNNNQLCAANITENFTSNDACPTVINFADFTRTCDNPITTRYRVKRPFGHNQQSNVICGKQNYCEISTFYRVSYFFYDK
jgi:hypothetical protein